MKQYEKQNTVVTANAIQLGVDIVEQIAGNEISNHLNGELVRPSDLSDAVAARIQQRFSQHMETV